MSNLPNNGQNDSNDTGVVTRTRPVTKKPSMYKVLLLNDDYTPMEFVVYILERFFSKQSEEATKIIFTYIKVEVVFVGFSVTEMTKKLLNRKGISRE